MFPSKCNKKNLLWLTVILILWGCQTTLDQSGPTFNSSTLRNENSNQTLIDKDGSGEISFKSIPLISLKQFLNGEYRGNPISISGKLNFPPVSGQKRLPSVVILHGSGGLSYFEANWQNILNNLGFATFVIDSESGRSCNQVFGGCAAQHQGMANIVDAYQALNLLSNHPRIDPTRIAVLGLSIGGKAALYSSVKRFQRLWAHPSQEFAAYVPLYPPCNTVFIEDEIIGNSPIRIHIGDKDEWTSVQACQDYVNRLRARAKDVKLIVYSGAHHGFDTPNPMSSEGIDIPGWKHTNCRFREDRNLGDIPQHVVQIGHENSTKKPTLDRIAFLMHDDECATGSGRIEYDPGAAARVERLVGEFLTLVLK